MSTPGWRKLALLTAFLSDLGEPPGGPPTGSAGGELAGTYPNPTVASTHSGSAHHDPVTVGTGLDVTGQLVELDLSEVASGGELGGNMDAPTVDATHSGSSHAGVQSAAESTAAGALSSHVGDSDPHTGYRLESADHSHATTGLQAGQVDHGALGGLADDDHPQYATNVEFDDHSARHDAGGADVMAIDSAQATGSLRTITTSAAQAVGTAAAGNGTAAASSNHVHPTGAGTPSTQAFGDAAATGTGPAAAMTDHKHAMPTKADLYSQAAVGTYDAAIANTETVVVARTFAANELAAGQVYKFEAWFTKAGTNANAAIIRIRLGTTTLTGNIAATLTTPSENTAVPGKIEGILFIVSDGSGGTARGSCQFTLHLGAVTLTSAISPATSTVAVNTTTANMRVEFTFISGVAGNTYTFRNAVMYRVA